MLTVGEDVPEICLKVTFEGSWIWNCWHLWCFYIDHNICIWETILSIGADITGKLRENSAKLKIFWFPFFLC